jgi:hypothetical protein
VPDIVFDPTFRDPTPWVDARDRVQAGGTNGFNARFSAIAADLAALSDVVGSVNSSLLALGQRPPAVRKRLTLPPGLLTIGSAPGWAHDLNGFARRPGNQQKVSGVMPVVLPAGAKLLGLRVVGQCNSSNPNVKVFVALMQSKLVGAPLPARPVADLFVDADPFDSEVAIAAAAATVDENSRYFLLATVENAVAADDIALAGFQILYQEGG